MEEETEEEKLLREKAEADQIAEANELFLISHLPKNSMDFVVCMDTLGLGSRYTDEQLELSRRFIKLMKDTLLRLDRFLFKEERLKRAALGEMNTVETPSDDEIATEKERLLASLERQGLATTDADVQFKYRQGVVRTLKMMIAEFRSYNVFNGDIKVLQALFYMLDYSREEIADVDNKPVWNKMRLKFNEDLFQKIQNYEPREAQMRSKGSKYATVKALKALLKGLTIEKVKEKNHILSEIFGLISDALAVKAQAKAERLAAKKAAKEAEDAAKAAEAAPAQAEEAEGEAQEGEEEDE